MTNTGDHIKMEIVNHKEISTQPLVSGTRLETHEDQPGNATVVYSKGKGKKRLRSMVWDHIDKIETGETPTAVCRYCQKSFVCDSSKNGTTHMLYHLKYKCPSAPVSIKESDPRQKTLTETIEGMVAMAYNGEAARTALAEMIVLDEFAFNVVEGEGFRKFCAAMQPKFTVPSRSTITRDCMNLYYDKKIRLKGALACQRMSLTTDTWTSIQNVNYMCLTAHFIDKNWIYHKKILNFCVVESHKGDYIGRTVENCLIEWGIRSIFTVTVDNASSNNGTIAHLKRKTRGWSGTVLDHEFLHMRCCAHILNLVVNDGLKQSSDSIEKLRNAIKFVRSSPSRLSVFKKCACKVGIENKNTLCLDVTTRWNSTYRMLENVIIFQKAFECLEEDDLSYMIYFNGDEKRIGPPEKVDFDTAVILVEFLKLFYEATLKFSGSKFVTSNACFLELFTLETKINKLAMSTDDLLLSSMAKNMKSKFHKYWGSIEKTNLLLYVAAVLDPRRKMRYISFCFKRLMEKSVADEMIESVKLAVLKLYQWFAENDADVVNHRESSNMNGRTSGATVLPQSSSDADILEEEFRNEMKAHNALSSASELEVYLDDSCLAFDNMFDILGWWKLNSKKYPVLSKVARAVLAIPVSTVASESTFSTGGRILDQFRSCLAPERVEALICAQNWLKKNTKVNDLKHEMDLVANIEELGNGI